MTRHFVGNLPPSATLEGRTLKVGEAEERPAQGDRKRRGPPRH